MQGESIESLAAVSPAEWNAVAGHRWPFLQHEFLHSAEATGCVSPASGWQPRHIILRDRHGKLVAAMPLYEKTHSWGEFVFDWAWAQAYHRVGIEYYPKLVSAIPFTPAPCPKLLATGDDRASLKRELISSAMLVGKERECSSLHLQFVDPRELPLLQESGLMLRKDCQFHWHNRGYRNFDEFLASFSSAKRRKARQDRRRVAEQGISFRWLHGDDLDASLMAIVYELISITFMRRGSQPYFNLDFFLELARKLPRTILVVLAERKNEPIAAAVFYVGETTLYGRYWGADADYNALHFETCYYQGIAYCIENNLKVFEPGTQGEHKISRGFQPVSTWSAHWLAHSEFSDAIAKYLAEEGKHIDRYIEAVDEHSPYRADGKIE
ncbi:MAG: GNAT family N-acetyltransferase [Woeseiaceae bacterium]